MKRSYKSSYERKTFVENFINKKKFNEKEEITKLIIVNYKQQKIGCLLFTIWDQQRIVEIKEMFIIDEYQRQGIGAHCLNTLFHENCDRIRVSLSPQKEMEMKFFDKVGFIPIKTKCNSSDKIEFEKTLKLKSSFNLITFIRPRKILIVSSFAFFLIGFLNFRDRMLKSLTNFKFLFLK